MQKTIAFTASLLLCLGGSAVSAQAQSINDALARLDRIASGEYAREVERAQSRTPAANWTPARIRSEARQAVLDELRDPSSARVRNVRRFQSDNGSTIFCGEVASRNGYGGMSSFHRFEAGVTTRGETSARVDPRDNSWSAAYFNTAWN